MSTINPGDTAFLLICTALVCMMTPALALFYGGLVKQRDVLSIMIQNFVCIGVVGLIWVFGGFSLAFGPSVGGVIGNIGTYFGMYHVGVEPNSEYARNVPFILVFGYQMMFAIITPALMTGAFVGRIRFGAYLVFIALWTILIYLPVAHWIWGGGFLSKLGVVDFAGGIVIHATAGVSALATARYLGKRLVAPGESSGAAPASLPLVALGAGLLWFGWFGFNAGGAYAADALAAYAFTNTMLAGSIAMLVWMYWEWRDTGRPSFSGVLVGAVTGLATITPASGYVEPMAALLIGAFGATACYNAKYIQQWLKVDDTLEVFRAHGVGGITGSILIGILASSHINAVSAGIYQLSIQIAAVIIVAAYAWIVTNLLLRGLDRLGNLRVPEKVQEEGLDNDLYGERAFNLWNMKASEDR